MSSAQALTELGDDALVDTVVAHGGKPFQARQIRHWLDRHGARSWTDFRNLPKRLLEALATDHVVRGARVAERSTSRDGTEKLLLELADGESVESVIIPDGERVTLCISTQVGCPVGCIFCASGLEGVRRNLTAGEIVEQVLFARDRIRARDDLPQDEPTNVVVMGLGEPLLNLDNLLDALHRLRAENGIALGARRITVSTSGYPERMDAFSERADASYGLAVSLHAADDALRRELVPTAKANVAEIVAAARRDIERRGREVTFEIVLLDGLNDGPRQADALVRALRGLTCTVNLIPWNPVEQIPELRRPRDDRVDAFAAMLRDGGLRVTVRRQRGADEQAACGQLRIRSLRDREPAEASGDAPEAT